MKTFVSIFFSLILASSAFGKTYYLSSTGADGNTGTTSASPWKTFPKVLSVILSGDTIMLKRGDVFRDSAVFSSYTNLVFMSYGNAAAPKPVVSGSDTITGWTLYQGNIYVANGSGIIQDLFVDNKRMTCARYPNSGWLRISNSSKTPTTTYIYSDGLSKNPRDAANYWLGARCHWHRWSWWDEIHDVVLCSKGGKITLNATSNLTSYPAVGWGFYLDNKLEELDSAGEWYQDKKTWLVYLRSPFNDNPSLHKVEGAVRNLGLSIKKSKIQDVAFSQQAMDGLVIDDSCIVDHCLFENIYFRAIQALDNAYACRIRYNEFYDNNNICINWYAKSKGSNVVIEHNIIRRTAIIPANQNRRYYYSPGSINKIDSWWPYNAHASAIVLWYGTGAKVRYNRIDSTGYIPISLHGNYATVEYNYIKDAVLNLNDGGGIYANCGNSKIKYNIVLNVIGSIKAAGPAFTGILAQGIWPEFIFDHRYNTIDNNTVSNCSTYGLFLTSEFYDTVRSNVLYNNKKGQMDLTGDISKGTNLGHVIENNILFGVGQSQRTLYYDVGFDYGSVKNNFFGNPFTTTEINPSYTPEQWDLMVPWAKGGNVTDSIKVPEYRSFGKGPEMAVNPDFSQPLTQWVPDAKSNPVAIVQASDQPLMNGSCMKISFSPGKIIWNYVSPLSLEQGSFYELRFNYTFQNLDVAMSSTATSIFTIMVQDSLTHTVLAFASFPAGKLKKSAWIVFPCKAGGKIQIQLSHTSGIANSMWMDNFSIKKVRAQIRNASEESQLIYNDSLVTRSIPVGPGKWHDIYGKPVSATVSLDPFTSKILIRSEEDSIRGVPETFVPLSNLNTREYGNIIAYPNPVVSQLCITGIAPESTANIIDANGRLIRSVSSSSETIYVDMEQQASGIYIIIVTDKEGNVSTGKILKQ